MEANAAEVQPAAPGSRDYNLGVGSTNSPNAPAPQPGTTPAAPNLTGSPAVPAQAPNVGTPPAQPAAPDPVSNYHSTLGKITAALLGKQIQYVPDAATGTVKPVEVQNKPGDFFKHVLTGAVLGMAASHGTNSALAGFSKGAAAGIENNREMDAQKYARAQRELETQQSADKATMEKQRNTAQMEMWNKEQILHERDHNLREREFVEGANERQTQLQKWALESGGYVAPLSNNGQPNNGKDMMAAFTQDPARFRPPQGFDRLIVHDVDTSGLQYDAAKGWTDKDGNPANLEDHTTWHVMYVPQKPQPVEVDGATLNKLFPKSTGGLAKPDQTYRMPWAQIVGLATAEHETTRRESDEARKDRDQDRKDKLADLRAKGNEQQKAGATELQKQADDYSKFLFTAQGAKSSILAAKSGDELANSLGPLQTALLVTTANGVHRINMTEVEAAGPKVGSLARRVDAQLQKAGTGKLPAATLKEMAELVDRYTESKYNAYLKNSAYTAKLRNLSPDETPILDRDGSTISLADALKKYPASGKNAPTQKQNPQTGQPKSNDPFAQFGGQTRE